jgi:hypothetical protein
VDHIAGRPSWDCLVCEKPWPCAPAREYLATTLDRVQLAMTMWDHLESAAGDMPVGPPAELFDRFLRWTG